jgi:hypothetical protein
MILRRITSAFRKQDWFTVAVETLIVVLGVFLGIQLGNWNEDRQKHAAAVQYEQRLLEDLQEDVFNYAFLRDYYRGVLKGAEQAYDGLTGKADLTDTELLVATFRASQYNWAERHRATFDELVASGDLELIDDPAFRARISGYYTMDILASASQASLNSEYRRAFRMLMPPDLQQALSEQCGDREDGPGAYTIDYPCTFEWPASEIAAQAAALRTDPDILPLLRLRITNLRSRDFELDSNFTYYRLADFLPKAPEGSP